MRPGAEDPPVVSPAAPARTRGGHRFLERARVEADRYGPDAWIFIRELLQNARDAGASTVTFTAEELASPGCARLVCRDDGEGMSFDHARRYLFALYASSKELASDQAGRFGVGFWSVLRFQPTRVIIRSQPATGEAWEIELDGDLQVGQRRRPTMTQGTEIILERPPGDGAIAARVADAARQNGRFLRRRGHDAPLIVTVNGAAIHAPFALPPPSAAFARAGLRGVVGLGNAARVELFSRGLRVRSAATLDDLLSGDGRHTARSRVRFPELPARLAPQAILESDRLEVLLSRSDARDSRALRRLVRLAQHELERLVSRQLDAARPLPWWRRLAASLRLFTRHSGASLALRTLAAAALGALLALVIAFFLWGDRLLPGEPGADVPAGSRVVTLRETGEYSDLAAHYLGPQVDDLRESGAPVDLRYTPTTTNPYFAALVLDRFERFDGDARPPAALPEALPPYVGAACDGPAAGHEGGEGDDLADDPEVDPTACVAITLGVRLAPGLHRIPVPTGHRLDPKSLELELPATDPAAAERAPDGLAILASPLDQPVLRVTGSQTLRGTLRYRTAAAAPPQPSPPPAAVTSLPPTIAAAARELRGLPPADRVAPLVALVREHVAYSTDPAVTQALDAARAAGHGLFERTLEVGRGDCDVQNALLVALLQEAGIPARLAIGYVGRGGATTPWFHAWAEHRVDAGPWRIADASAQDGPLALLAPEEWAAAGIPGGGVQSPQTPGDFSSSEGHIPQDISQETENVVSSPQFDEGAVPRGADEADRYVQARTDRTKKRRAFAALAFISFGLLALGLLVLRRTQRSIHLDSSSDLSELVMGALQHPESFRALPEVFQRPLIPVIGGGPLSLEEARRRASRGELFRTGRREGLAAAAIAGGSELLDEAIPEARAVADALGAIDLDRWSALLTRATETPLLAAVNRHLMTLGDHPRWPQVWPQVWPQIWWVAAAAIPSARTLDLSPLRLPSHPLRGRRLVLVPASDPWLAEAEAAFASHPEAALFAALDRIAELQDLPAPRRARLLLASARATVTAVAAAAPEASR